LNRRKAIAALAAPLAASQSKISPLHKKFIGVWKLVSCESKVNASGEIQYPYGKKPVGRLTYDAAGRMSAQLMNPGRRTIGGPPALMAPEAVRGMSSEDMRETLMGYTAYFGAFEIDEAARTVIHHVEASLISSRVRTDMRRTYEFSGANQLILIAESGQSTNRLVWEREIG
jgi:hypothetical protein